MESKAVNGRAREKVYHTVTACVRCRQRKTRCDSLLPRCEPCERSNSHCEYYDSVKNRVVPRTYITSLQETVRKLHAQIQAIENGEDDHPNQESMARAAALVKFRESNDSRFLGPSSGFAVTRFVMDLAKRNGGARTIRQVVPDRAAQEIKQKFDDESAKPTSKVYPYISSVPATTLPGPGLLEQLVQVYMVKAQYMLPLLHEPTFRQQIWQVYDGSTDPTINFQLRLVIAISMQKLDPQYAGLADSYYLAALQYLTEAVQKKDLSTLQCFALMAQYSLLTPTRTAANWVVGLAVKLALELGLCDEETIARPKSGHRPNFLEVDMRRRLFWIVTSLEYGLAHSLGRPSAFGASVDNLNVEFFHLCHDSFITPEGLLPGHHPVMQKCLSVHFFKMRILQAEIRKTLYLKKRDTPTSDRDPWFVDMLSKIDAWVRDMPKNDEGSGLSASWFEGRKHTMLIFMYRPSPQIPYPSTDAAQHCYMSAIFNAKLFKKQIDGRLVDITWIFTQAVFMTVNTILWSISYPEVRRDHSLDEVQQHLQQCMYAIEDCAERWPGARSAHQLYTSLVASCLKCYSQDEHSPEATNWQAQSQPQPQPQQLPPHLTRHDLTDSQGAASPASATTFLSNVTQSPHSSDLYGSTLSSDSYSADTFMPVNSPTLAHPDESPGFGSGPEERGPIRAPLVAQTARVNESSDLHSYTTFAPGEYATQLPAWDPVSMQYQLPYTGLFDSTMDNQPWLASLEDEFPGCVRQQTLDEYQADVPTLNEQDHFHLLASLEKSQFPDMSGLISDSNTLYSANLP